MINDNIPITDYLDQLYQREDLTAISVLDVQDEPYGLAPGRYDCSPLDEGHQKFVRYVVDRTKELGRKTLIIRTPVKHTKPIKLPYADRVLAVLTFLGREAEELDLGDLVYVPNAGEDTSVWPDSPMIRYNISDTGIIDVYIIPGLLLEDSNPLLNLENAIIYTGRPENKEAWEGLGMNVDDLVPRF